MSTLKVTNIAGLTGSSTNVAQGVVKYWATNQGKNTVGVHDSFNQSSLTDRAQGSYQMAFTSALGNVNHSQSGGVKKDDANDDGNLMIQVGGHSGYSPSTSQTRCMVRRNAANYDAVDTDYIYVQTIGDLA